jgi:hypothetical protein
MRETILVDDADEIRRMAAGRYRCEDACRAAQVAWMVSIRSERGSHLGISRQEGGKLGVTTTK